MGGEGGGERHGEFVCDLYVRSVRIELGMSEVCGGDVDGLQRKNRGSEKFLRAPRDGDIHNAQ